MCLKPRLAVPRSAMNPEGMLVACKCLSLHIGAARLPSTGERARSTPEAPRVTLLWGFANTCLSALHLVCGFACALRE